jgi:AcrR family transcriptional regulator
MILDAAVRLADRDGLEALTMRALAKELGTSGMAVYRYFEDKRALVDSMLDYLIDPESLLAYSGDDPVEAVTDAFRRIRALFLRHPALVTLAGTPGSIGPNGLRFLDGLLAWLQRAGLGPVRCSEVLHRLLCYTLGAAVTSAAATQTDAVQVAAERFQSADVSELPHLGQTALQLVSFTSEDMFETTLHAMVAQALGHAP